MTPQQFIAKWKPVTLSERSACQSHFNDLCELLGQPKPVEADPDDGLRRRGKFSTCLPAATPIHQNTCNSGGSRVDANNHAAKST